MKHLLLIIFTAFSLCSYAQWEVKFQPAGEHPAGYINQYTTDYYEVFGFNERLMMIRAATYLFAREDTIKPTKIIFYEGKNIVDTAEFDFFIPQEDLGCALFYREENEELFTKIVNHLKSKGRVRFVMNKYPIGEARITILPNPDIVWK